jgi:hypothetical protein
MKQGGTLATDDLLDAVSDGVPYCICCLSLITEAVYALMLLLHGNRLWPGCITTRRQSSLHPQRHRLQMNRRPAGAEAVVEGGPER